MPSGALGTGPRSVTGPAMRGSSGCSTCSLPLRTSWPGDLGAPAREHAQHAPFDAADAGPGLDFDGVGVHGGAAVAGRDVNVFGLVVRNDEAVSGGMNLDPARQGPVGRPEKLEPGGSLSSVMTGAPRAQRVGKSW